MAKRTKICFGLTLRNNAKYLPEAIESLLGQTYPDFQIVAIDDFSTDNTDEIMRGYAAKDNRISYFRNNDWLGLIGTWRKAFFKANELYQPKYFAWASDHDRWHPEWLEKHLAVLEKNSTLVLAYPLVTHLNCEGEEIKSCKSEVFETIALDPMERLRKTSGFLAEAGSKIYGLFRSDAVIKAGVFRNFLMPDRLLLIEISVYGAFKHIPENLWFRRHLHEMQSQQDTIEHQKKVLSGNSAVPFYFSFPHLSHTVNLMLTLSVYPENGNYSYFSEGLMASLFYWEGNKKKLMEKELEELNRYFSGSAKYSKLMDSLSVIQTTAQFLFVQNQKSSLSNNALKNILALWVVQSQVMASSEAKQKRTFLERNSSRVKSLNKELADARQMNEDLRAQMVALNSEISRLKNQLNYK